MIIISHVSFIEKILMNGTEEFYHAFTIASR